ncbi:lipopolysaccharide biosynthesis protein [Aliiglaciecola sp.]|nr:lipopolysaccharide biosynthesis protein [Aliiglaciecola sp.]
MQSNTPQHTDKEIHAKLFSSSMFMLITRMSIKSLGLISTVILARLLVPEDFGLVAIAMAIYAFIELFGAFGLGTVLIQKQEKSVDDYNTAWTFKVLFGLVTCIALIGLSWPAADFYDDQRLVPLVQTIGLLGLISGFANIGVIDFQKDLDFKKEFKFQLLPKIFSFTITISLAFYLQSYWALVLGTLSFQLAIVALSYLMHPFRPRFSLVSFSSLFSFSKWLLLNNIVFFLNNKMTELLIGRLISARAIGLYSMANEISTLPTTELAAPINRASFPVYSKFANKLEELKRAYLNTLAMTFSLTAAASVGIFIVADLFVINVLGEKWIETIELMQWVALSSIFLGLGTNNGYIYLACGKPKYSFFFGLTRAIIFLTALVYLVDIYGLLGAGYAMFFTAIIMLALTQTGILFFLKLNPFLILKRIVRPSMGCLAMWSTNVYLLRPNLVEEGLFALFASVALGGVVYLVTILLLWRVFGHEEDVENVIWKTIKNKF